MVRLWVEEDDDDDDDGDDDGRELEEETEAIRGEENGVVEEE